MSISLERIVVFFVGPLITSDVKAFALVHCKSRDIRRYPPDACLVFEFLKSARHHCNEDYMNVDPRNAACVDDLKLINKVRAT